MSSDTISGGGGGIITLGGSGDRLTESSETIDLGSNEIVTVSGSSDVIGIGGTSDALTASNDTINGGGYAGTSISGSSDTINLNANSGASVSVGGSGDVVYASGDVVSVGANSSVTVDGGSDTISGSSGGVITLGGSGDHVTESNETIDIGSNETVTVSGSGDRINVDGTGATVIASGDTIVVGSGDSAAIDGTGDAASGSGSIGWEGSTSGDSDNGSTIYSDNCIGGHYEEEIVGFNPDTLYYEIPVYGEVWVEDPVVLNLTGSKVQTTAHGSSTTFFDAQENGQQIQTGWVTAGEGLLVIDPNNKGVVTSSADLVAGFAALSALDSNHDGILNASDPGWTELKVWVDKSGHGIFSAGSLYTLAQLGITSINLNALAVDQDSSGNTILQDSTFTWANGSTGDIAGVDLVSNPNDVEQIQSTTTFLTDGSKIVTKQLPGPIQTVVQVYDSQDNLVSTTQTGTATDPATGQPITASETTDTDGDVTLQANLSGSPTSIWMATLTSDGLPDATLTPTSLTINGQALSAQQAGFLDQLGAGVQGLVSGEAAAFNALFGISASEVIEPATAPAASVSSSNLNADGSVWVTAGLAGGDSESILLGTTDTATIAVGSTSLAFDQASLGSVAVAADGSLTLTTAQLADGSVETINVDAATGASQITAAGIALYQDGLPSNIQLSNGIITVKDASEVSTIALARDGNTTITTNSLDGTAIASIEDFSGGSLLDIFNADAGTVHSFALGGGSNAAAVASNIDALYGSGAHAQHGLDLLVQAMASFGGPSAAISSTILASLDQPPPGTVAQSLAH